MECNLDLPATLLHDTSAVDKHGFFVCGLDISV